MKSNNANAFLFNDDDDDDDDGARKRNDMQRDPLFLYRSIPYLFYFFDIWRLIAINCN